MTIKNAQLEHFNNKESRHKPDEVTKTMADGNQPADRVKVGGIEATVWDNGNFGKSVTITKNYKTKTMNGRKQTH